MIKDLEARLLASVPSIGHFQSLEEKGITEQSFEFYGPMYRYINNIIEEHNHLPRLMDLRETFNVPDHVQRKPEEYEWLLDEFLNLSIIQRIQDVMDTGIEKYGDSPKDLLPSLIKDLTSLSIPDEHSASISDMTAMERMARYEARQRSDDMIMGIPTGLRYFDSEYRIGWMPGELNGIIGRIYVGKSWLLLYHGIKAWMAKKRVLLISPEMPEEEAENRIDALMCGMQGIPIDISDIIRGYKPTSKQREVFQLMAKRGDWVTLSSSEGRSFTLGDIARYVKQYSPDILLIDGLILVGGASRLQPWEQMKELSYGLKNLAIGSNIVVLVAHQANRGAKDTARPPGLHEIYMGDSFGQAADRILVLSRPTEPKNTLVITVQKFRKGQPDQEGAKFEFIPGHGILREREPKDNLSVETEVDKGDLLPIP